MWVFIIMGRTSFSQRKKMEDGNTILRERTNSLYGRLSFDPDTKTFRYKDLSFLRFEQKNKSPLDLAKIVIRKANEISNDTIVICGRKTYEDLKSYLKFQKVIILTRSRLVYTLNPRHKYHRGGMGAKLPLGDYYSTMLVIGSSEIEQEYGCTINSDCVIHV